MKKKICLFILLIILTISTSNVLAMSINCPTGPYSYGDHFDCNLLGTIDQYDTLTGSIYKSNYLDCQFKDSSLDRIDDSTKDFSLKGTPETTTLATITCVVTKKLDEQDTTIVKIEDLKYSISGQSMTTNVYSDPINIAKETVSEREKYRNTDNTDALLKSVTIDGVTFPGNGFTMYQLVYNIKVPYEISVAKFNWETVAGNNADVKLIGDTNLSVGQESIIDLKVVYNGDNYQGEVIVYYTFYITRYAEGEEIYYEEDDATLSALEVEGYKIGFDKTQEEYTLTLPYGVDSIKVTATPNYSGASVVVSETNGLEDGSVVSIKVKSKSKNQTNEYKIHIKIEENKETPIETYIIFVAAFIILLLIITFIRSSKTKYEAADGSGAVDFNTKKNKKKNAGPEIPEAQNVNFEALRNVTKDDAAQMNVIKIGSTNVAQVMQDNNQQKIELNKVTSVRKSYNMQQKSGARPKLVTGTNNVISEDDYTGDIFEEYDAAGNFLRYVDAEGNTIEYVDEYGNQLKFDDNQNNQ